MSSEAGAPPAQLMDLVRLVDVMLVESSTTLNLEEEPPVYGEQLTPSLKITAVDQADLEKRNYAVYVSLTTEVRRGDAILHTVRAKYLLAYVLDQALTTDVLERDREDFATRNAVFNAWPYYREFLHSMSWRAGHEGLVLPLLRLNRSILPPVKAEKG